MTLTIRNIYVFLSIFLVTTLQAEECIKSCVPEDLNALRSANPYILDLRPPDEFEAAHINGSVRIDSYAIKTKEHLKPNTVVLVTKEALRAWGENICNELKRSGFNTVYATTLSEWHKHGGDLSGPLRREEITATELALDMQFRKWLVVSDIEAPRIDEVLKGDIDLVLGLQRISRKYPNIPIAYAPSNTLSPSLPEGVWSVRGGYPALSMVINSLPVRFNEEMCR